MNQAHSKFSTGAVLVALLAACGADTTAPEAPTVEWPEGAVKENPWTLGGRGEPGATVEVRGGAGAVAKGSVAANGEFLVPVSLKADATNELIVSLRDEAGNESTATQVTVVHDGTPPAAPDVDPVVSPTRVARPTIRGRTESSAQVTITGGESDVTGTADQGGNFAIEVPLKTSLSQQITNELSITSTDTPGNVSAPTVVTIVFDANLAVQAPQVDQPDAPVNTNPWRMTGTADPGAGLVVSGGAQSASGTAASDGTFALDVKLRPNSMNALSVFAVGTGSVSSAVVVEVVHDDIAPATPAVEPLPERTAETKVTVRGTAEVGTSVKATRGSVTQTVATSETGTFSVELPLEADAENQISVVALDAAQNESEAAQVVIRQDVNTPVPPRLDPYTSPTSEATLTLTGSAGENVGLEVSGGLETVTGSADANGRFSLTVGLKPNAVNELVVTRTDTDAFTLVVVVHDDVAPAAPLLAPVASPTNRTTIELSGTTEAGAALVVTGGSATARGNADAEGRFTINVGLAADATSTLSVTARDRAGNVSDASSVQVTHSGTTPDAPVLDTPNPAPTNAPTYVVTGRVTQPGAGIDIEVSGGAEIADGPTDEPSGAFEVLVQLTPNTTNELSVVSKSGSITSPAARLAIVHDDIAPAAPVADQVTVGKGNGTCLLRGQVTVSGKEGAVEARARVRVTNATSNGTASVKADDTGAFSTTIGACRNEKLRLVATDDAGNTSEVTELTTP